MFIMHCFYLSNYIALTVYFFVLIYDSCLATIRNGKSIITNFTYDTIKKTLKRRLVLLFLDNLGFISLEDKCNIRSLLESINFICNRCKTGQKSLPEDLFSACFKNK